MKCCHKHQQTASEIYPRVSTAVTCLLASPGLVNAWVGDQLCSVAIKDPQPFVQWSMFSGHSLPLLAQNNDPLFPLKTASASTDPWINNRKHRYNDDPEEVKDCEITHKSSQIMKMINPHRKMTNEN